MNVGSFSLVYKVEHLVVVAFEEALIRHWLHLGLTLLDSHIRKLSSSHSLDLLLVPAFKLAFCQGIILPP